MDPNNRKIGFHLVPLSAQYSCIIAVSKQSAEIKLLLDSHYLLLPSRKMGLPVVSIHCPQWSANPLIVHGDSQVFSFHKGQAKAVRRSPADSCGHMDVMEPIRKYVLLGKHQTYMQNMKINPEKQHRGVSIFQTEGKRDTCYHEILTEDNMFKKDLLFHRNCWNFLSIFQQNSLPWPCLAQQGMQKQEWLDEALKSVPVRSGCSPAIVQSSGWLYVGL